jgi:hypothetical protein
MWSELIRVPSLGDRTLLFQYNPAVQKEATVEFPTTVFKPK